MKKTKNIRLTDRDIKILKFINRFGMCEITQLSRHFKLNTPYNYELMGRLVKAGLVKHTMVYHQRHGVYWLTRKGSEHTHLPPLKKIPTGIYRHEMLLLDLYFALIEHYPDATWTSERELVWDKFKDGVGKKGHVADGMMQLPDGKKIMIELELSLKGRRRTEDILKQYSTQFDIEEVWYFCADKVVSALTQLVAKKTFIKIKLIKDYIHAESRRGRFMG